jgi:hypothetical protein
VGAGRAPGMVGLESLIVRIAESKGRVLRAKPLIDAIEYTRAQVEQKNSGRGPKSSAPVDMCNSSSVSY